MLYSFLANTSLFNNTSTLPNFFNENPFNLFFLKKKNLTFIKNTKFQLNYSNIDWNFIFINKLENLNFNNNNKIIPLISINENIFYENSLNPTQLPYQSIYAIFNLFFKNNSIIIIEVYKILSILFYLKIFKR